MGKAKRAKEKRLLEEQRRSEAEAKKRAEKKENIKIATVIIAIVLVIAILVTSVCLVVISVKKSGNYLRNRVSVSSENYEINNAMLSYLFADTFYSQKEYFDYYSSYFGLDTSSSLKSQSYSDSMTWYDYFLQSAANSAASVLVNAEAAKVEGIEIEDLELALVDKEIEAMKADAVESDMDFEDYLYEYCGLGVKEQDVRDMLELYYLSLKYYYHVIYGIEITDEELEAYASDNEDNFLVVDYKVYTIESDCEDAEAEANKLAAAESSEDFDNILMAYLKEYKTEDGDFVETVEAALVERELYTEDSDYSEWLFDDERKVGDTTVIEDDDSYTVYMLITEKRRDDTVTKNVRHMLFIESEYESKEACLAAAEAALAEFNATSKTEDDFAALVPKYTGDTGSIYNGGLYENILEGEMVEEFEDWCFDETRQVGDVEIVYTESYGYHIMYFCGDGEAGWAATAREDLTDEAYEEISEEILQKYEVTIDLDKASNVPDIN